MKLFHRTSLAGSATILANGFEDREGSYQTQKHQHGVRLTDNPLNAFDGTTGVAVLVIEIPEEDVKAFEWFGGGKSYREFLAPAALVNRFGRPTVHG